ncbi:MAG: serine aminopeptidase domain-containing protein [Geminicoccaceae bacterium]
MTPLYFGSSERRLFGVYHAPALASPRVPAALLCAPFGQEAIRSQRIYRLLAEQLSRHGAPVLRFDYTGCGDSAGACEAGSLSTWAEDIASAHQELCDMSGATRILWLGLRLGASLALHTSSTKRVQPAGLVLWEPVIDGARYVREICDSPTTPACAESCGIALGSALVDELNAFNAAEFARRPARKALVISWPDRDDHALCQKLDALGCATARETDPDALSWNSEAAMNAFIVPRRAVDMIVHRVVTWR